MSDVTVKTQLLKNDIIGSSKLAHELVSWYWT